MKKTLTFSLVFIAVVLVFIKYWDYVINPWTRDGQVKANVIQVTSRISGPIVKLPIKNNQFVKKGDLLFEIDPRTFKATLDQATAQLEDTGDNVKALERQVDASRANVKSALATIEASKSNIAQFQATIEKNKAELQRQEDLIKVKATSVKSLQRAQANFTVSVEEKLSAISQLNVSKAALSESKATLAKAQAQLGALGENNAQIKAAIAAVRTAQLNYEFTKVYAPVDGYVTNLLIKEGTQSVENQPILALIDTQSYWITGYFKESDIRYINIGDRAVVTLMSYDDIPLEGEVTSLGWGISQEDGTSGNMLLPTINPTFEWIRLAQRVPILIHLKNKPDNVQLRVGTTCSVLVQTNSDSKNIGSAPKLLQ